MIAGIEMFLGVDGKQEGMEMTEYQMAANKPSSVHWSVSLHLFLDSQTFVSHQKESNLLLPFTSTAVNQRSGVHLSSMTPCLK